MPRLSDEELALLALGMRCTRDALGPAQLLPADLPYKVVWDADHGVHGRVAFEGRGRKKGQRAQWYIKPTVITCDGFHILPAPHNMHGGIQAVVYTGLKVNALTRRLDGRHWAAVRTLLYRWVAPIVEAYITEHVLCARPWDNAVHVRNFEPPADVDQEGDLRALFEHIGASWK